MITSLHDRQRGQEGVLVGHVGGGPLEGPRAPAAPVDAHLPY